MGGGGKVDMAQIERQELNCHDCGKYIQFDIDLEIDGNHVLECPICKHQHCRTVIKGKVTNTRWDARNGADKSKGDKVNPDGCQVLQGEAAPEKPKLVEPAIAAPNRLPVIQVSTATITWTYQSTYTIYQGTQQSNSGNVYLYMSWMNNSTTSST
jgi:hypothetical protein